LRCFPGSYDFATEDYIDVFPQYLISKLNMSFVGGELFGLQMISYFADKLGHSAETLSSSKNQDLGFPRTF